MPRGQKSELGACEKRRQNRAEALALSAQAAAGEAEEAPCSSSAAGEDAPSSCTSAGPPQASPGDSATRRATAGTSCERSAGKAKGPAPKGKNAPQASTSTGSSNQNVLQKASVLADYLVYQYIMKEPIKKADMLNLVKKWCKKSFPEILRRTTEQIGLLYGLQLKEIEPTGNFYSLVHIQDDTRDETLSRGWRFPVRGLLMPLLGVIFMNGNRASENLIWASLNMMGIYDGKEHFIFGEPRKLITQDLVQEKYLVYQQIPDSDPPCYEFLWGPKSLAETSKMKVLEFMANLNDTDPTTFPAHYEEALKDEEERAQARAQAKPGAGRPSKARGRPAATSSRCPSPE